MRRRRFISSDSTWDLTWRRYRRSALATFALLYVLLMALMAFLAPVLANRKAIAQKSAAGWEFPAIADYWVHDPDIHAPTKTAKVLLWPPVRFSPNSIDLARRLEPPGELHRLGTDGLGRDVLARMIHGARVSLTVGIFATVIALVIGSILGAIAGYYGGAADWIVSRVIEVVLCFPFLFLVLGIVALFKPSMTTLMVALGVTSWTSEARFIRAEFLRIREMEFAQAERVARATCASSSATFCRTRSRP